MVKNLRYLFASLLMLVCGNVMAEDVTFDFNNDIAKIFPTFTSYSSGSGATYVADGEFNEDTTSPAFSGVTITVTASDAEAGTRNRLWTTAPRLRMYDGKITFASTGEKITKIVLTRSTNKALIANSNTADSGELTTSDQQSNGVVTWTGEAQSVAITIAGNTQFSKAVVTLGEGGETPPTPEIQEVNVAKALEIINGLADGATTTEEYQVKGFVVGDPEFQRNNQQVLFGNVNLKIADAKNGTPTLTIYRAKNFKNTDFTENDLESIKDGDEVVFQGKLQKYVKDETMTPELAQGGVLISVNGKTESDTPVNVEKADNIKAFLAMTDNTVAELKLTNAKVLYKNVNGQNIELFVSDATGAIDLYNLGIAADAGQVLNGTIIGMRGANSGFTLAMKPAAQTNAATVTISGTAGDVVEAKAISFDEAADYFCNYVVLQNVAVDEELKNAVNVEEETLPLYDRFKLGLISSLKADGTKYDIYGLMYDGGSQYGAELVVTKVTLAGGGVIQDEDPTAFNGIEALVASAEDVSNIELTLTNAKVVFNDNNSIYVRQGERAVCFYQMTDDIKALLKTNAIVNGKIRLDYLVYNKMPELKVNKYTSASTLNVVESEEEAVPVQTTLTDVSMGKNVCDLVTLKAKLAKEVTYKEDGVTVQSTTYFLEEGDVKLVCVNNGKGLNKIDEGTEITVIGVVNTTKDGYQVKLTKTVVNTEGISTVTTDNGKTVIFNLAGQRMEKTVKGLNIINGKKVMIK